MILRSIFAGLALTGLAGLSGPAASAAPTPVPGGANGVSAVSGKLGETVFNGVLRIKIVALREATDADHAELAARSSDLTPSADKKVLIMQSLLRNGVNDEFIDLLQYTLADKDDVSVEIPTNALKNANIHILQGAAGRQTGAVLVDKDFVPVKLIVQCLTCGSHSRFRPVRFTIPAP
jgi:hypothetical protein